MVDQTRGLLREIESSPSCSSQSLHERGIKVTCVGSSGLTGKILTTEIEEIIAILGIFINEKTNNEIYKNGELLLRGPAMLVWPPYVFHRVESKEAGSASLNFAYRDEEFDVDHNFSIYDVNISSGTYKVIRVGKEDQF